ncbi:MAG TPA: 30S ribosomal protein S20 [Patescibacteria group bacterium]|nr:30S ribosomal protein S20 [Patescibacteria group bacterium]
MPNTKAAKKELRKNAKKRHYNREIKRKFKDLIKKSKKAIEAKDKKKAEELVPQTLKALDKAAQKGVIKKNTRDRKKSRLHQAFNAEFSSKSEK